MAPDRPQIDHTRDPPLTLGHPVHALGPILALVPDHIPLPAPDLAPTLAPPRVTGAAPILVPLLHPPGAEAIHLRARALVHVLLCAGYNEAHPIVDPGQEVSLALRHVAAALAPTHEA